MKLTDQEIEKLLLGAPKPKAPAGLKAQLARQVRLTGPRKDSRPAAASGWMDWLRRWWPALAPASVSLACAAYMVSQEQEIRGLQHSTRRLAEQGASPSVNHSKSPADSAQAGTGGSDSDSAEQNEITRLKARADQLGAEVARLERMQAENENLRKQPATPVGTNENDLAALGKAREKAMSLQCINNLKQIGLAARMWALDNRDTYPRDFRSMSNELSTPKILACPAETNRPVAATFAAYPDTNCSYELLAPSGSPSESARVLARCPIHGHVSLCDGSVPSEAWKQHPDWFVQRDDKLYLEGLPQK